MQLAKCDPVAPFLTLTRKPWSVPYLAPPTTAVMNTIALSLLAVSLAGCMGWAPGRQAYWDEQVKEMCEKDGGVTIYECVRISKAEINRHILPMTADGKLSFTTKELAHPNAPIYAVERITYLREGNPRVRRSESIIMRRTDQAVVARWVIYARAGGDFPTGFSEGTSFICPDLQKMTSDLHEQLFIIEGDSR